MTSIGVVVGAVVGSIVLLLIGLTAGLLLCYCCYARSRKPHPSLPVHIYEDVDITTIYRHTQQEIKMDDNVAYGHIQH
jgi:hypothetical protein